MLQQNCFGGLLTTQDRSGGPLRTQDYKKVKNIFKPGDVKIHKVTITKADVAAFGGEEVHPVCSTFALAREMEWSSRLFVLEMKEEGEEGIGTQLAIEHHSPALLGEELLVKAVFGEMQGNFLRCTISVYVNDRLIASGTTGQKIVEKEKLNRIFENLKKAANA